MQVKTLLRPDLVSLLPLEVKTIFQIFSGEILLVGGCVRDLLLEKKITDFDFATRFLPEEIIKILEKNQIKAIPTGLKHGTITALLNQKSFEITTLRKDLASDGRHAEVQFVDDYCLDASRRDFTINALYLDEKGVIYDYFDGISDLQKRNVSFIGDASKRINEDFLRILRFFRFSAIYGSGFDKKGLDACLSDKNSIKKLSFDRIRNEIFKVFEANSEKIIIFFDAIEKFGIRDEILPISFKIKNLVKALNLSNHLESSFAAEFLFFTLIYEKNINIENDLKNFNFSNQQKRYFAALTKNVENVDLSGLKELLAFEEKGLVKDFYLFNLIQNETDLNLSLIKENLHFITNFILPEFPLKAQDLMDLGVPSYKLGELISYAKKLWARSGFKADKVALIKALDWL